MQYRLAISQEALAQLRVLPGPIRRNVGYRLQLLQNGLAGDVKKLSARKDQYRLRVGDYRILFRVVADLIEVFAVKLRREAYE